MLAMVLQKVRTALELMELPDPQPGPGEIRVKVAACGVCRTDLHVIDGELPDSPLPVIPGHEIIGRIDVLGDGVMGFSVGERVGIPWLAQTCGVCPYCCEGRENLCDHPRYTGYTRDGGFAEKVIADARFVLPLGEVGSDVGLAPLLCAGLIGWRSLGMAGIGKKLGLYGFGASAHIVAQVANGRAGRFMPSPGRETWPDRLSPGFWTWNGRVDRMRNRRFPWTRQSFSRRSGIWCLWR